MKSLFKKIVVAILTWEAKLVLKKYKPKIVAITGSVGKTSTKDAVYSVLSQSVHARKSEKSFNSELGVPLTVLGLPNAWSNLIGWLENIVEGFWMLLKRHAYPEWLVLEVGADRPGDIRALAWLKPNIVIFTRFPEVPVHVEFFGSKEAVIEEKRELKRALSPEGTLIVNADDPEMQDEKVHDGQHLLSYGFAEKATVRCNENEIMYKEGAPSGMLLSVQFQQDTQKLTLAGTIGTHHLYPILAALAVAVTEGIPFNDAVQALEGHTPPPARMRMLEGRNGSMLIDDSYNASPVAVTAGLETLTSLIVEGRKIVVLGDMLELGEFSVAEHQRIGEIIASSADVFVAVGVRMRTAAETVQAAKGKCRKVESVQDSEQAAKLLQDIVGEKDLVYIKGSQGIRMERTVAALLRDPTTAAQVLVRQEDAWRQR